MFCKPHFSLKPQKLWCIRAQLESMCVKLLGALLSRWEGCSRSVHLIPCSLRCGASCDVRHPGVTAQVYTIPFLNFSALLFKSLRSSDVLGHTKAASVRLLGLLVWLLLSLVLRRSYGWHTQCMTRRMCGLSIKADVQ